MSDRVSRILRLGSLLIYDVDQESSKYRSIGVGLKRECYVQLQLQRESRPGMGEQMTWRCYLVGPNGTDYELSEDFYPFEGMDEWATSIVEYWVISDYGLSEIVAQWLSQLGNAGIVGLYVSILVSLGALIRKVVPNAWYIVYMTLSDALPLLQLIDIMEICRITEYP